jgi:hypothetical protein
VLVTVIPHFVQRLGRSLLGLVNHLNSSMLGPMKCFGSTVSDPSRGAMVFFYFDLRASARPVPAVEIVVVG